MSFKTIVSIAVAAIVAVVLGLAQPAFAADLNKGKQIFGANCAACHMGGRNVVNAQKTLSKADLEKWGMNSLEKIKYQVTNGKNAMPAFKSRLNPEQIENVASYVLAQSEAGW